MENIKNNGEYGIKVKLFEDIHADVKINVISDN